MSYVTRIQYQQIARTVPPPGQEGEVILADKWHPEPNRPPLAYRKLRTTIALVAALSGAVLTQAPAEVITADKWHPEIQQPRQVFNTSPLRGGVFETPVPPPVFPDSWHPGIEQPRPIEDSTFLRGGVFDGLGPPIVFPDSWHPEISQPLALVVHLAPRLAAAAFVEAPAEVPPTDSWHPGIEQPRQVDDTSSLRGGVFEVPPPPDVFPDSWHPEIQQPQPGVDSQVSRLSASVFVEAPAEVITADKWHPGIEQPYQVDDRTSLRGGLFEAPRVPDVFPDSWHPGIDQPRQADDLLPRGGSFEVPRVPDVFPDSWHPASNLPTRGVDNLAARVPASAFVEAPAEVITVDKWHPAANQPRRAEDRLLPAGVFETPKAPDIFPDSWHPELSQPVRRLVSLASRLTASALVEAPAEVITADKWHPEIGQPRQVDDATSLRGGAFETPRVPDVFPDSWHPETSQPRQIDDASSLRGGTFETPRVPDVFPDSWHPELSQPRQVDDTSSLRGGVFETPRVPDVFPDSWHPEIGRPVRRVDNLAARLTASALVEVPAEVITVDKWFSQIVQPVRRPVLVLGAEALAITPPDVFPGSWHPLVNQPLRGAISKLNTRLFVAGIPAAVLVDFAVPQEATFNLRPTTPQNEGVSGQFLQNVGSNKQPKYVELYSVGSDPPASGFMGKVSRSGLTASIDSTDLIVGKPAGLYVIDYYIVITSNDAGGATLVIEFDWTDDGGAKSFTSIPLDFAMVSPPQYQGATVPIQSTGADVQFNTVVSMALTTGAYSVYVRVLALG